MLILGLAVAVVIYRVGTGVGTATYGGRYFSSTDPGFLGRLLEVNAPILLYAGAERAREARVLSRLWLGSDALVVTSMDQLASALRIAAGED